MRRCLSSGVAAAWLLLGGMAWAVPPSEALAIEEHALFAQASQALQQDDLDLAEASLRALQVRLPDRPEIINNLGVIAQRRGLLAEAATLFKSAAQLKPHYLSIYSNATRWTSSAWHMQTPPAVIDALPRPAEQVADLASVRTRPRLSSALATLTRLKAEAEAESQAPAEMKPAAEGAEVLSAPLQ